MPTIKSILQAARLRTLPLSVSGIIVGSFLAYGNGNFDLKILVLAILTTIGFQVLSNFANDYGDGIKGTDNEERIGPTRMIQSGAITQKQMLILLFITGAVTLFLALALIFVAFGNENPFYTILFFCLGIASIVAAIKYTVGNKAYGYSGFGDLFVLLFFGLLSVVGSYFLFTKKLDWTIFLPALSVGLLSVGVLHLNNMRDRNSDMNSGKNTMAVKLGVENSKKYYYYLIGFSLAFALFYVNFHFKSLWNFLFLIAYFPIVKQLIRVLKNKDPKMLDPELKILALSTFLFSILFGIGQIIS
jgi:1,4-dihydroxy-2-naphthoate octaprenyltransferase